MHYGILDADDEAFFSIILFNNDLDVEFGLHIIDWITQVGDALEDFTTRDNFYKSEFFEESVNDTPHYLFKFLGFSDYQEEDCKMAEIINYCQEFDAWDLQQPCVVYSSSVDFIAHFIRSIVQWWLEEGPRNLDADSSEKLFAEIEIERLEIYYKVFHKIRDLNCLR